jgi:hypothetical protein
MKFFRLDLLTLLISLFILNSCKNEGTVGLGVDQTKQLSGSLIDTSTIVVSTVSDQANSIYDAANGLKVDSIITSGLTKTPLSYFQDPVLGETEANIAVQLNLPGQTAYTLPTGSITVDSAVLALKYADGFYGDSLTTKYKVNVYQLATRLIGGTYYNVRNFAPPAGTPVIGTRTFFSRTHDSLRITDIISGAPDTLKKVAPQLRIPINKDFVNSILFNAPAGQLNSNTAFINAVKGLYITLDKTGTTGSGGTFMFSLADSLNVYYHVQTGTTIDTSMVALPLTTHMAEIRHNPSATVTTALKSGSGDVIYLQGLAGLKTKISFPYLKSILDTVGSRIVINRAELVITTAPGSTIPYHAQPKLTMYRYDIAHQPIELQDAGGTDPRSGGISTFGGYFVPSKSDPKAGTYNFVVTAYIQDLMDGNTKDYGTYIATIDNTNTTTVDIAPTVQTAGRTIAVGSVKDKNSPLYNSRIKLNIIYTKINK